MKRDNGSVKAQLLAAYIHARECVIDAGYAWEVDWQDQRSLDSITEPELLLEHAWVVLCSGMRASVVGARFPDVADAFLGFRSSAYITEARGRCVVNAMKAFGHAGKIDAIADMAALVAGDGFEEVRRRIRNDGVDGLQKLPFIGQVTKYHLAKNLGMNVSKPDRHLVRIAQAAGLRDSATLCRWLSWVTGDRIATIDVILWRYATLESDYLGPFSTTLGRSPRGMAA